MIPGNTTSNNKGFMQSILDALDRKRTKPNFKYELPHTASKSSSSEMKKDESIGIIQQFFTPFTRLFESPKRPQKKRKTVNPGVIAVLGKSEVPAKSQPKEQVTVAPRDTTSSEFTEVQKELIRLKEAVRALKLERQQKDEKPKAQVLPKHTQARTVTSSQILPPKSSPINIPKKKTIEGEILLLEAGAPSRTRAEERKKERDEIEKKIDSMFPYKRKRIVTYAPPLFNKPTKIANAIEDKAPVTSPPKVKETIKLRDPTTKEITRWPLYSDAELFDFPSRQMEQEFPNLQESAGDDNDTATTLLFFKQAQQSAKAIIEETARRLQSGEFTVKPISERTVELASQLQSLRPDLIEE